MAEKGPSLPELAYKGKLELINKSATKETLNQIDEKKYTALMWAAFRGYDEIVQFLISRSADLNMQNVYGRTALMLAALNGSFNALTILSRAGANDSLRDRWDESVYEFGDDNDLVAKAVISGRGGALLHEVFYDTLPGVLIALILDYYLLQPAGQAQAQVQAQAQAQAQKQAQAGEAKEKEKEKKSESSANSAVSSSSASSSNSSASSSASPSVAPARPASPLVDSAPASAASPAPTAASSPAAVAVAVAPAAAPPSASAV